MEQFIEPSDKKVWKKFACCFCIFIIFDTPCFFMPHLVLYWEYIQSKNMQFGTVSHIYLTKKVRWNSDNL